jgi:DNA-binding PadR family transcriptional regulator
MARRTKARRSETPVTTAVAVLQGLRWGPSSAVDLVAAIGARTAGLVRIHVGLVYKALDQLVEAGLVRRGGALAPPRWAAIFVLTARGRRRAERDARRLGDLFSGP